MLPMQEVVHFIAAAGPLLFSSTARDEFITQPSSEALNSEQEAVTRQHERPQVRVIVPAAPG